MVTNMGNSIPLHSSIVFTSTLPIKFFSNSTSIHSTHFLVSSSVSIITVIFSSSALTFVCILLNRVKIFVLWVTKRCFFGFEQYVVTQGHFRSNSTSGGSPRISWARFIYTFSLSFSSSFAFQTGKFTSSYICNSNDK